VDASAETNTGGFVAPAPDPTPVPAPTGRATPRAAPAPSSAPATAYTPAAAPASAPVSHAAGNAVEPPAGGEDPAGSDEPPLEPLPPSTGEATAKPQASDGDGGSSLAMTGGEIVTTLTLGLGFLAAGLAGTAFARRRRALST
jgi:hypothetical protein